MGISSPTSGPAELLISLVIEDRLLPFKAFSTSSSRADLSLSAELFSSLIESAKSGREFSAISAIRSSRFADSERAESELASSTARLLGLAGSLLVLASLLLAFLAVVLAVYATIVELERERSLLGSWSRTLLLASPALWITGWLLVLLALRAVSRVARRPSIFRDALLAFISLLASAWGLALIVAVAIAFSRSLVLGLLAALLFGVASLALIALGLLANGFFLYKAMSSATRATGIDSFRKAGLAFLSRSISIILVFTIAIAPLLELLGAVFLLIAFYSLRFSAIEVE